MEDLFNLDIELELELELEIYTNSLKYYKTLPRGHREGPKIVASQTLCYILYNLYHTYLSSVSTNDLYPIVSRKLATLFKWHNRNERIINRMNNLIYVDIEDIMFFMLYIRANNLSTSIILFIDNLMNIVDKYIIENGIN